MLETIKSYLVSLGFSVDKQSYGEATKAIDSAGDNVAKFAGGAVKNFTIAGVAVASFAAAAVVGLAKYLDGLGEASIKNEMLARQMWTSEQNAMSYNATLKAMGVSLQDLYLSPTLMSQFKELRQEANSLQAPSDYKEQMKLIQSVTFEFKRMKLEAGYALQWIGYYFVKYMSGPITTIKKELTSINNLIVKEMPSWTKVVAQVLTWFARFGITTVRAIKDVIQIFDDVGSGIPKNIKLIGAAIVGLGAIISTGPIGIMIAIFTGLILLLDDFYTYLDGGESQFGPFWKKLVEMFDKFKGVGNIVDDIKKKFGEFFQVLNDNGSLDNMKETFINTFDIIDKLIDASKNNTKELYLELNKQGVLNDLLKNFEDITGAVAYFTATLTDLINKFLDFKGVQQVLETIGGFLDTFILKKLESLNSFLKAIKDDFNAIGDLLNGDFKGFGKGILNTLGDLIHSKTGLPIESIGDKLMGLSGNGGQGSNFPTVPSYLFPFPSMPSSTSNKVTLSPTYNIYGSDPNSTADAAQSKTDILLRNMRGYIQ